MQKIISLLIGIALMSSSCQTTKYTRDVQVEYTPEHMNLILPIVEPEKIYSMSLDRRKMRSLPEEMGKMSNIRELQLYDTRIKNWTQSREVIAKFKKLRTLYIVDGIIDSLPISKEMNPDLEELILTGSKINLSKHISLINSFDKLIDLGIYDISEYDIKVIESLQKLRTIDIGADEINSTEEILNSLSKLSNLKTINIGNGCFEEIPSNLNLFTDLEAMGIYHPQNISLIELLNVTSKWDQLTSFKFYKSNIKKFPITITEHRSLKALLLPNNPNLDHQALFAQLVQMPQLEELDLSDTYRTSYFDSALVVPSELAQLSSLRKLDVSRNTVLDHKRLVEKLVALPKFEHLDISHTSGPKYIVELPDCLSQLKSLKVLNLKDTGPYPFGIITEMPPHLEQLNWSDAHFDEDAPLPMIIFTATSLKSLSLNDGRLTELPEAIGNLTKLEHLDLGNNQLHDLPKSITKLKKLRYLNLMGTHISESEEKRREIEALLPNTLVFFGEYAAYDPNWGN